MQHNISILIPTFNEAEKIGGLCYFLKENGGEHLLEIIVIDAESSDETASLAAASGAKVLSVKQQNRAAQMNAGAKAAQGSILYFVHADTLPPTSFAHDIVAASSTGKPIGCYRYQFDSPSLMLKINAFCTRFPFTWCQGGDKTFYIPKKIFFEEGCYDESYVVMEEYDFLRRIQKKHKLHIIPKNALVSARKYEGRSWLRVQIANLVAINQFRYGVSSDKIRSNYVRILG